MDPKENSITVRPAEKGDLEYLFSLRNNPKVYSYFKNPRPVTLEEHTSWFEGVLKDNGSTIRLNIISFQGKKAGQLRFDRQEDGSWEISISIDPVFWGKHIAFSAIQSSLQKKDNYVAHIHPENVGSMKLFEKLGFVFYEDFKFKNVTFKRFLKRSS
ncbi:MAG: GNAT family N-acetyltransferase [Candidatus Woesearchaeota archaeon]|jgi:RimJ/RimL family protein N-acetyltransferase|nr:GNAT family N-acetyltransferase [Candidatus Woesearchaeota archaeon]MDP7324495.1 GNAT family N-acetyltransferase [Candidatus Woesearchaeota archaeon]MDP7458269.1 GNAT family N-acetyltransferase [Candidatus Woesearchaeota archaeon]|tara:strand:- start:46 stop:516 length:471 start_codon:yes stop_codon:yes gene_type:complete